MKYHETFEDYIISNEKTSLHPVLERNYVKYPERMEFTQFNILWAAGCGKYTQVLLF